MRSRALEDHLLERVAAVARARVGVDARAYPGAVRARLELGARRYGDGAFMGRDNLTELLEETPDVAAYALLELQRLRGRELPAEAAADLLRAAVMGAAADAYARRARAA